MKTEHIPTGWNWSKLYTGHAPPIPPTSNPLNGARAYSRPAHTGSRTYNNPLFETQDIESENPLFHSQDKPSPNN
eukprot:435965-Pelagomonas_calceolata.AAC.1